MIRSYHQRIAAIVAEARWAARCAAVAAFVRLHRPVVGFNPALERVSNRWSA